MLNYLQYYLVAFLTLLIVPSIYLGGAWLWLGFVATNLVIILGDALLGNDTNAIEVRYPKLLELPLHFALPILGMVMLSLAWVSGEGSQDLLGIGAFLNSVVPYDVFAARESTTGLHYLGGVLSVGFLVAGFGTNVAHELTHRTHSRLSMITGRWLLSMSCNADFSIEHVYGHHVNVGTERDPATAKRGDNIYAFIVRSSWLGHLSAWELELRRLKNRGYHPASWHNQMLTGYAMSLCWLGLFVWAGGWLGAVFFLGQAFMAKSILEIVNFMEHYGMSRKEGERVMPHHSWNSNKRMSGMILFSLTRHSAHHENGALPFWELEAYAEDAPTLPWGYLSTIFICLVPPLWRWHIDASLRKWEAQYGGDLVTHGETSHGV